MTETTTQTQSLVGRALLFLAGKCDGARSLDGHGFNKHDSRDGHDMASKFNTYKSFASAAQFGYAKSIVWRYRKQLQAAGFDLDALQAETFQPRASQPQRTNTGNEKVERMVIIEASSAWSYKTHVGPGRDVWLPKNQIEIVKELVCRYRNGYKGGSYRTISNIRLPRWLAEKEGIHAPPLPDAAWVTISVEQARSILDVAAEVANGPEFAHPRAEAELANLMAVPEGPRRMLDL